MALAALLRGEAPEVAPVSSRVVEHGPHGVVVREGGWGALLASLRVAAPLGPRAAEDSRDKGLCTDRLPLPYPACAPVRARIVFQDGNAVHLPPSAVLEAQPMGFGLEAGLLGSGIACDAPLTSYRRVVVEAIRARETCDACASVSAQLWALGPSPGTHVNDFAYLLLRGERLVREERWCWVAFCIGRVEVFGNGAAVELQEAPRPGLPGGFAGGERRGANPGRGVSAAARRSPRPGREASPHAQPVSARAVVRLRAQLPERQTLSCSRGVAAPEAASMLLSQLPLLALALVTPLALAVAATPAAPGTGHYQGAGVVVGAVDNQGQPIVILDNGAVVCLDTDADGVPDHGLGGACIRFQDLAGDSVLVQDFHPGVGDKLAFQVCVDLTGDQFCGGASQELGLCKEDLILFSHRTSDGAIFNPLYVNPFLAQFLFQLCQSKGFPGFVVIMCAGVHSHLGAPGLTHTQHATEGLAQGALTGGTPSGDYCGAPLATKAYALQ